MKRFFLFSLLALLLIMIGACSKPTDESGEPSNTSRKDNTENEESHSTGTKYKSTSTATEEKNQASATNEPEKQEEHPVKDFDVEDYLNEHYPIDHTYYTLIPGKMKILEEPNISLVSVQI